MLKYFKTLDVYKSSNGNNRVDLKTGQATSYKWWTYSCLHPKKKNTILFNYYHYSQSTSKHQRDALRLFQEKGFNVEIINIGTTQTTYENFLEVAPKRCIDKIVRLHVEMNRKGSKKVTNQSRIESIERAVNELKDLVKLGCKVDLNEIENQLNLALAEDLDLWETLKDNDEKDQEKLKRNREKLKQAKDSINNFDEVTFATETINDLGEITL